MTEKKEHSENTTAYYGLSLRSGCNRTLSVLLGRNFQFQLWLKDENIMFQWLQVRWLGSNMVTVQAVFSPSFINISTNSDTRAYTLRKRKETQFVLHPKVGQWKWGDDSLGAGKGGRKRQGEEEQREEEKGERKEEGGTGRGREG